MVTSYGHFIRSGNEGKDVVEAVARLDCGGRDVGVDVDCGDFGAADNAAGVVGDRTGDLAQAVLGVESRGGEERHDEGEDSE